MDPEPVPKRIELQSLLETLLGSGNVYFQPNANVQMVYPAIVYEKDAEDTQFADNSPYRRMNRYMVTSIDRDPDSDTPRKLAMLPLCSFSRHFVADNLNHDVYNLYF